MVVGPVARKFPASSTPPRSLLPQITDRRAWARGDRASRFIDVAIAIAVLPFVIPICVLIAAIILIFDGGPVVFGHRRMGRFGQPFRCFKFRTMLPDAEDRLRNVLANDPASRREWELTHKLARDPRVTPIGNFLRRTSLDELPQFYNVLRGEMSIVGPRPIVEAEAARYGRHFKEYCSVRPGLTGLWQVSGRNDTSYRRRVALDRAYVRSRSPALNLAIMMRTIPAVMARRGSY